MDMGLVAEQFVNGRTAIIGDAAHQFPPSGGFGMNTGIQDTHNMHGSFRASLNKKTVRVSVTMRKKDRCK